jgi:hypothetical protein
MYDHFFYKKLTIEKSIKSIFALVTKNAIRTKLTATLAKICNNGNLETMKIPANYESPRGKLEQCTYQVIRYEHC